DITKKTVATGSITPRREIQLKPRVSGILQRVAVVPGDVVEKGDLIAEIRIVPDVAALTRAEGALRQAQIQLKGAELEYRRGQRLEKKGLASDAELTELKLQYDLRRAELAAARADLRVVRDGAVRSSEVMNTEVRATVKGTVLEVPVEVGASVIEANNFNEGTTIAAVADMNDMIFIGFVDEAEVDKIRPKMPVNIRIGAIEDKLFRGELETIAPKGQTANGAVQFEVRAALGEVGDALIRAGYSANAEIVLEHREQVLAIRESFLQFDGDRVFVEVQASSGRYEQVELDLGVSDGIVVEVKRGLGADARVKMPSSGKATM
ncbi:MAG: efflux RND transporter periplasmic adaptor subunit, partial [Myxococcota bacterium]